MYPTINAERGRLRMTQYELAEHLGVTSNTVGRWLRGVTDVPASKIIKMAELFHCTTDYLLGLDDNRTNG